MDVDAAWCPACDRQIQPKRYFVTVPSPAMPPAPPSSPNRKQHNQKAGLVNGTGRLRHNGTVKAPPHAPPAPKTRLVIDKSPIPLYCSDACHMADISARRTADAPLDPNRESTQSAAPVLPAKKTVSFSSSSGTESDTSSSVSTPPLPEKPLTSMEKFAKAYNMHLPPVAPVYDECRETGSPAYPYTGGIMMAGKLISSYCPVKPARKEEPGRYRPPQEPVKPIPGWNDGSDTWRSNVYNFTGDGSLSRAHANRTPPRRRVASSSGPSSAPVYGPSPLQTEQMLAKFNDNFARRCESRASVNGPSRTATPTSPSSTHSLPSIKRERSLLHPDAEGKLLVPDVKLKVRSGSSGSLASVPRSVSSRRSARSPLSATSASDEDNEDFSASFTLGRPQYETRSWSYDNVQTYPIMQLPPKKIKKMETQIIEGEEREVEVEVEVPEVRKCLFNFAPTTKLVR